MSDPILAYGLSNPAVPRFSYDHLPEFIDYVVLTHSHMDHIMFETPDSLRHKIKNILVPKCNGGTLQDPS